MILTQVIILLRLTSVIYVVVSIASSSMMETLSCPECDEFKTSFRTFLFLHLKAKHCYACPYICEFCPFSCSEPEILKEHEAIHKLVNKQCSHCFYHASDSEDLVKHESSCADKIKPVKNISPVNLRVVRKQRPICVIESVQSLSETTPPEANTSVVSCHMCSLTFQADFLLKIHLASMHGQPRWLSCNICSFQAADRNEFVDHKNKVHGISFYFCSKCEYSTISSNSLKRHEAGHMGVKNKCCSLCDFKTTFKAYLAKHMKTTHSNPSDESRLCDICGETLKTRRGLLLHIRRMHYRIEPIHRCSLCNFKNKQFWKLRKHFQKMHGNKAKHCSNILYNVYYFHSSPCHSYDAASRVFMQLRKQ